MRAKYRFYCYLQITEHILYETHYDWKRTAESCAKAPKPWNGICIQSFGRDASGASHYKADVADDYCKLTGSQIAQCIYGVARDFANNDAGGTRAADFCNLQRAGTLRGFCFYAVGTILDHARQAELVARDDMRLARRPVREGVHRHRGHGRVQADQQRRLTPGRSAPRNRWAASRLRHPAQRPSGCKSRTPACGPLG